MTEPSTIEPRLRIWRKIDPPEPQIRIAAARQERLRRRLARRIAGWAGVLLIVYWLGAFTLTHMPMPAEKGGEWAEIPHADKLVHMTLYTGLALLLSVWFGVRKPVGGALVVALVVLCVLAGYAAFDEISQAPVGRDPDIRDWFADVGGVNLGLCGFFGLRRWVRR